MLFQTHWYRLQWPQKVNNGRAAIWLLGSTRINIIKRIQTCTRFLTYARILLCSCFGCNHVTKYVWWTVAIIFLFTSEMDFVPFLFCPSNCRKNPSRNTNHTHFFLPFWNLVYFPRWVLETICRKIFTNDILHFLNINPLYGPMTTGLLFKCLSRREMLLLTSSLSLHTS